MEKRERGRIQGLPIFWYPLSGTDNYGFQIWPVHSDSETEGPSEQKAVKKFGEKGAWAYPGTAQFFRGTPIISGTGKATNFKFCMHILSAESEQKPIKNFREKGAWAYPDTVHFFGYPLLSHERVKQPTSNFACTFIGSIGTKAH